MPCTAHPFRGRNRAYRRIKMSLSVATLFSSSKGNCTYIHSENTGILIDAGRSLGAVKKALCLLGSQIENISAVVVTHEHSDHVNALSALMCKHGIPVHMTNGTADAFEQSCKSSFSLIERHESEYEIEVGDIRIASFRTPHDSADSVGYIVSTADDTVGYATDMGIPTKEVFDRLIGCSKVVVESNYDEKMLRDGPYPYFLKKRILSNRGHLSNENCALLVSKLAKSGVKGFMLAHLSETNNLPELALGASCNALCECGKTDVKIIVADAHCPTMLRM